MSSEYDSSYSTIGILLIGLIIFALIGRIARLYTFSGNIAAFRNRPHVQMLVLGDIGRSPRMQYHAVSLADAGCSVDLIGYVDTKPIARVSTHRYIKVIKISEAWKVPSGFPKIFYLLFSPFKAIWLTVQLTFIMGIATVAPNYIFVQNPPSIPTLAVAQLVAWFRSAWLIIDWHNFGYSQLALRLGTTHPIVNFAKWYEKKFGSKAYAHLCVTQAMADELKKWNVKGKIIVFYDKPQRHFKRLTVNEIHKFHKRVRLENVLESQTLTHGWSIPTSDQSTLFTYITDAGEGSEKTAAFRPDRPLLVVSSTSWTEDEDFSLLLDAISRYEERASEAEQNKNGQFPKILFAITGKGPMKHYYEEKISKMQLAYTRIVTLWLEAADYPLLLGSADIGVSLHRSSSGKDLPMKIVDMFGCSLPVCALNFECLHELVDNGKNGLIFNDANELADQFESLFKEFSKNAPRLETMREYAQLFASTSWADQWNEMLPWLFIDEQILSSTTSGQRVSQTSKTTKN
ncbi:uncharacterized protein VTP21DRAFT_10048 [Calcarisporiella thermophila]|uniref:uncharacterized protein n=1 Tax=Calcarisporiella thermophila TaxID=911321 RepID=UPI003743D3B6